VQRSRERLHGHSYRVSLSLTGQADALGYVIDFHALKDVMRALCAELDGRFLLPALSPFLAVSDFGGQINLLVNDGSRFSFPSADVISLELVNVTVELLSKLLCRRFIDAVGAATLASKCVRTVTVGVSETVAQEARFTIALPAAAVPV
jgi:6-pyruvoyltetrahydropterin/6-carboxytetrahydropterin synthase